METMTTIAVDRETHALVRELFHQRKLRTMSAAVRLAVESELHRADA